ncbi:46071_t:CDS:2, partial [Gigaspora margarita]
DPNAELFQWLEVIKLQKGVYSKPFILPNYAEIDNVSYTEKCWWIEGFLKAHTKGVIYGVDSKFIDMVKEWKD